MDLQRKGQTQTAAAGGVVLACEHALLLRLSGKDRKAAPQESALQWLPQLLEEIKAMTRQKIHALFLTQEMSCWPSLETVFAAAQENEDYVATLVYTPFHHENLTNVVDYYDAYRELGLPVLRHNAYDLPAESPDVVFVNKPYANIPELYQEKAPVSGGSPTDLHCLWHGADHGSDQVRLPVPCPVQGLAAHCLRQHRQGIRQALRLPWR